MKLGGANAAHKGRGCRTANSLSVTVRNISQCPVTVLPPRVNDAPPATQFQPLGSGIFLTLSWICTYPGEPNCYENSNIKIYMVVTFSADITVQHETVPAICLSTFHQVSIGSRQAAICVKRLEKPHIGACISHWPWIPELTNPHPGEPLK